MMKKSFLLSLMLSFYLSFGPIGLVSPSRSQTTVDNSARSFINNPLETRIESGTLYVSKIFKWFPEDFNNDVVGFLLKYADGDFKKELIAKKGALKIKYLKYDWSLNNKQLIEK